MRPSLSFRLRRGAGRGAALPLGALLAVLSLAVLAAAWSRERDSLRLAELDRERGRVWAMTCAALDRAVQSRRAAAARAVAPAELQGWSLLPAGMAAVGRVGGGVASASYGVVLADGVPMAACALTGPELSFRSPALRAGAAMGGLDLVGAVGGEATAMHARLADVEAVLGPLPAGSLFATGDWGVARDADRLHRRAVGGRPELARMEADLVFGPNAGASGQALLPAAEIDGAAAVVPGENCGAAATPAARRCHDLRNAGRAAGLDAAADRSGQAPTVSAGEAQAARLELESGPGRAGIGASGGFRFGGGASRQFDIGGMLSVGGGLRVEGRAAAARMAVAGRMDAAGRLAARSSARAGRVEADAMGADSGSFRDPGEVTAGGCTGCRSSGWSPR